MKHINTKLSRPALITAVFAVLAVAVLSLAIVHPVLADVGAGGRDAADPGIVSQIAAGSVNGIGSIIQIIVGGLLSIYIFFIGSFLLIVIKILVQVASYNDFVNSAVVLNGWTIVRDISNMFFILILLAIAFGTILGVDKLDWKQRLPKLLIFAVLINFTRVIAGIVIDFGQVIMITFVNGFKDAAGGNFAELLGIRKLLELSIPNSGDITRTIQGDVGGAVIDFVQIISGMIAAAIFATISTIVILLLLLVLIYRMVMLWLYVTISPIAFLLGAFPQGEKYYSDWWNKLISTVALGPVLAFFLWLSLLSVQQITIASNTQSEQTSISLNCGASEICQPDNVLKFIIGIGLLMGGLTIAQSFANSAGEGMGGLVGWAKKSSTGAMKRLSGFGTVQKARQAFDKKDTQAGGVSGLLARGAIYGQAGLGKISPLIGGKALGGIKAQEAVEKYQTGKIAEERKKIKDLRDQELLHVAKTGGGASYEKAAALSLLAERGSINEKNFSKEEIDAAKTVFGNAKPDYGQFMSAVKKQAPALAYDLTNPAEVAQFTADAGRGVARLDNLEAKYFTDELGGAELISGLSAGKTPEQIADIYKKLATAAKTEFKKQLQKAIVKGGSTEDMRQAYGDMTFDFDSAFPNGVQGVSRFAEIDRWMERNESQMLEKKKAAIERAKKIVAGAPGGAFGEEKTWPGEQPPPEYGTQTFNKDKPLKGFPDVPTKTEVAGTTPTTSKSTPRERVANINVTLPIQPTTGYSPKMPTEEQMAKEARDKQRDEYKKETAREVYTDYKAQPPERIDAAITELRDLLDKQVGGEVQGHSLLGTQRRLEALERAKKKMDLEKLRDEKRKAYVASEMAAEKSRLQKEIDELEGQLTAEEPEPKV